MEQQLYKPAPLVLEAVQQRRSSGAAAVQQRCFIHAADEQQSGSKDASVVQYQRQATVMSETDSHTNALSLANFTRCCRSNRRRHDDENTLCESNFGLIDVRIDVKMDGGVDTDEPISCSVYNYLKIVYLIQSTDLFDRFKESAKA